jgi:hypothetical protein
MKKIQLIIVLLALLPVYVEGQTIENINASSGTVSVGCEEYVNNLHKIWNVNIGSNAKVKINYNANIEGNNYDKIRIYSLDSSGMSYELSSITGNANGIIYSAYPTGKIKIEFTTDGSVCCSSGYDYYDGFDISFSIDDRPIFGSSLFNGQVEFDGPVSGNSTGGALRVQTRHGYLDLGPQDANYAHLFTNKNYFLFNKPVHLQNGTINTTNSGNLYFQTNGSYRMSIINSTGNVGIGTTSPTVLLEVSGTNPAFVLRGASNHLQVGVPSAAGNYAPYSKQGDVVFRTLGGNGHQGIILNLPNINADGNSYIKFGDDKNHGWFSLYNNKIAVINGSVGIGGDTQPYYPLDIREMSPNTMKAALARLSEGTNTYLGVKSYDSQPVRCKMFAIEQIFYNTLNGAINFWRGGDKHDGFITISIRGSDLCKFDYQKLNVYGTVFAKEVKITETGEADFVFNDDYHLKPLSEVNTFIKENKHLPEIPSATEMKESEGVSVGDMQIKLLQKIEELTLYLIQQENTIQELKNKIEKLETRE